MSANRFVYDVRIALTSIVGIGAVSAHDNMVATFRALGQRACGLGLTDLGAHLDTLAGYLDSRGSLGFEASMPVANEICAVHDRIEELATTLALWEVGNRHEA